MSVVNRETRRLSHFKCRGKELLECRHCGKLKRVVGGVASVCDCGGAEKAHACLVTDTIKEDGKVSVVKYVAIYGNNGRQVKVVERSV